MQVKDARRSTAPPPPTEEPPNKAVVSSRCFNSKRLPFNLPNVPPPPSIGCLTCFLCMTRIAFVTVVCSRLALVPAPKLHVTPFSPAFIHSASWSPPPSISDISGFPIRGLLFYNQTDSPFPLRAAIKVFLRGALRVPF